MKIKLFLYTLLITSVHGYSQKKPSKIIDTYRDTTYSYWEYDTIKGKVSYELGDGIVNGEGIIVTEKFWQCHKRIYDNPVLHDSIMKAKYGSELVVLHGGCYTTEGGLNYHKYCMIKINGRFVRVGEKYTFTPY